jgi:hypothetical protein
VRDTTRLKPKELPIRFRPAVGEHRSNPNNHDGVPKDSIVDLSPFGALVTPTLIPLHPPIRSNGDTR